MRIARSPTATKASECLLLLALLPLVERATQVPASERLVDERGLLYSH